MVPQQDLIDECSCVAQLALATASETIEIIATARTRIKATSHIDADHSSNHGENRIDSSSDQSSIARGIGTLETRIAFENNFDNNIESNIETNRATIATTIHFERFCRS